jgi:hypothetical protein
VRARHEVAALVAGLVLALDGRGARDRRRRHDEDLAPGKGARARLGQRDRIAFALDVQRVAVDLVEEQVAHRHRAQADRAVRAGHHQHATPELLGQNGVARIRGCAGAISSASAARLLDQRVDPLLGVALGHLHRRPDRHHRPRRVVDDVADPVRPHLGRTELRCLHEHHTLDRRGRRQAVHDGLQVRRAAGAPAPRLGGGLAGKHPVPIRPFRHGEQRIGRQAVAPRAFDLCSAFVIVHRQSTRGRSSPSSIRCSRTAASSVTCICARRRRARRPSARRCARASSTTRRARCARA